VINISAYLKVFIAASLPIGELRLSVPLGIGYYNLKWQTVLLWSFLGNMLPAILLLWLLEPLSKFLRKHFNIFERFFTWLFARTRKKHTKMFDVWGAIALMIFVAIPLPGTGGWTAAAAAFVFNIDFKEALPLIALGVLIAGVIVIVLTYGVQALLTV